MFAWTLKTAPLRLGADDISGTYEGNKKATRNRTEWAELSIILSKLTIFDVTFAM